MNFYIYFFNIFSMYLRKIKSLIFIYYNYFFSFVFIKKSITALDIKKKKFFRPYYSYIFSICFFNKIFSKINKNLYLIN